MNLLKDKTVEETEFIEVQTKSPRYCQQKGILPIFVVPGFKPKLIDTFYKNLPYPAFEAHFSKNISSVDELSEILVNVSLKPHIILEITSDYFTLTFRD